MTTLTLENARAVLMEAQITLDGYGSLRNTADPVQGWNGNFFIPKTKDFFVDCVANSGGKFHGGDFSSYEDVGIGSRSFSFVSDDEKWACLHAAKVILSETVSPPETDPLATVNPVAGTTIDAVIPAVDAAQNTTSLPPVVSQDFISQDFVTTPQFRGQLWEECPLCGTEPVCADCGYCDAHDRCGGAPLSSVTGEIYGGAQ